MLSSLRRLISGMHMSKEIMRQQEDDVAEEKWREAWEPLAGISQCSPEGRVWGACDPSAVGVEGSGFRYGKGR